jgi:glycosyltransferase involved in cell wall biosynthesis
MRVLLVAPNPKTESGGIAQWTGHILRYYDKHRSDNLDIFHCCRDNAVTTYGSDSIFTRLYKAIYNYVPICRLMKKELKKGDVDVVHICTSASLSLFLNLYMINLAHRYNTKVIMHYRFGRIPQLIERNNWESKMLKKVFGKADGNIVIDSLSFNSLIAKGYSKCCLLPNPLSPDIPKKVAQLNHKRDNKKVLFVGHVIVTKGVFELVKACKDIDGIELELIGYVDEDVRKELFKLAGNSPSAWLKIVGIKDMDYIIKSMLTTTVFALPTYTEGFPNVILESMACACPIVTTPVGAIPEMLDINGENPCGICVAPKTVRPLKEAVELLMNDKMLATKLGRLAQDRVNTLYSMETVWDKMNRIWANL